MYQPGLSCCQGLGFMVTYQQQEGFRKSEEGKYPSYFTAGVLHSWSTSQLEYFTAGVLHSWSTSQLGTSQLEYFTAGVLHSWSTSQLEYFTAGVLHSWSTSQLEYFTAGVGVSIAMIMTHHKYSGILNPSPPQSQEFSVLFFR